MTYEIDLSSELGEGFGLYEIAPDAKIMEYVTTVHIAGGFHGGDPHVMRETVELATANDVSISAHPGLPDRMGFGRRRIDASPEQLRDYVTYQIGALDAFCRQFGARVRHVKPHGALYSMLTNSDEHARAVMDGIVAIDDDLTFVCVDTHLYELAEAASVRAVLEGYVDLNYDADGQILVPEERNPGIDPERIADRFVRLVTEEEVETVSGETLHVPARTICVHGDNPNALATLDAIYARLEREDIELKSLSEMTTDRTDVTVEADDTE